MPLSALPPHHQKDPFAEGDGTDLDNRAQKWWSRGWNAWGPNATRGFSFPTLCGIPWTRYRVAVPVPLPNRWRRFPVLLFGYGVTRWINKRDESVVFVAQFERRFNWPWYRRRGVAAVEMRPGNAGYKSPVVVDLREYGPSPIQKFERAGFVLSWPLHVAGHCHFKRRRFGLDMLFARLGARWDSFDDYHVFPAVHVGGGFN